MLALAYDSGLRREELCLLATGDVDPAHRLLTVRAETTKSRRGRVVPYTECLAAYSPPTSHTGEPLPNHWDLFSSQSPDVTRAYR